MHFGIRANLGQNLQQLLQVLLVGLTIGMMRNVVPALAESEFGVPRGSFMLLVAFVVAFGFVKGAMNFVAGRMARTFWAKASTAAWLARCLANPRFGVLGDQLVVDCVRNHPARYKPRPDLIHDSDCEA